MQLDQAIKQSYQCLDKFGARVPQKTWQSVPSPNDTWEIVNTVLKADMPKHIDELARQCGIYTTNNWEWAENHFKERIGGQPLNPGEQWQNWPHYRKGEDDQQFKAQGIFSHSYMERFWPKNRYSDYKCEVKGSRVSGYRYEYGDWEDIVKRASKDPSSRQLYLSIWHPEDQSNDLADGTVNRRLPCSLGYHFLIRNTVIEMSYTIRSCDIIRHFRNDIYMAIRLAQELRDRLNSKRQEFYKLGSFTMLIGSLHCFMNEKGLLVKNI